MDCLDLTLDPGPVVTTPKIADRILDVMLLISELGSRELIEKTDELLIPTLNELIVSE